jgi:triosephosphate isomerase
LRQQRFWIGTGWKMNKTRAEAIAYAEALSAAADLTDLSANIFVLPPFTALATVCERLAGTPVLVGAQNIHWAESGAWTGEISASMVADCGARIAELGHSERRAHFGETDADINRKVKAALAHGLIPLVCIGETASERELDAAAATVERQTRMALSGLGADDARRILLAYEPVWAIGEGGTPATSDYAARLHGVIRAAAADLLGASPPVLYGGSVNVQNCVDLGTREGIDGLFIGRAAWNPAGLLDIARRVTAARG